MRRQKTSGPIVDDGAPEKWDTLPKRFRWVVANRKHAVRSLEDWSIKAGRARQYISSAIKRANEEGGSLNLREAAGLVEVPDIDIDLYWLATGRGDPSLGRRAPATIDPWPRRAAAVRRAIAEGVAYETIERVRRETNAAPNTYRDMTEAFWLKLFIETDQKRPRLVTIPTVDDPGDDA